MGVAWVGAMIGWRRVYITRLLEQMLTNAIPCCLLGPVYAHSTRCHSKRPNWLSDTIDRYGRYTCHRRVARCRNYKRGQSEELQCCLNSRALEAIEDRLNLVGEDLAMVMQNSRTFLHLSVGAKLIPAKMPSHLERHYRSLAKMNRLRYESRDYIDRCSRSTDLIDEQMQSIGSREQSIFLFLSKNSVFDGESREYAMDTLHKK